MTDIIHCTTAETESMLVRNKKLFTN